MLSVGSILTFFNTLFMQLVHEEITQTISIQSSSQNIYNDKNNRKFNNVEILLFLLRPNIIPKCII